MKIGIGLAAILAAAILSPASAFAADKAAPGIDAKQRATGMAEVPAVIASKSLACTPTDAVFMGEGMSTSPDGKKIKTKMYEVACSEGLGYILGNPEPVPLDCLKLSTAAAKDTAAGKKVSVPVCKLPANANPALTIAPLAQKAGVACTVDKARWIGESASAKLDQYEVGCSDGEAFLINSPQPGSATKLISQNCLKTAADGSCQYFNKDAAVKSLAQLASKAGRTACAVNDARWVGSKPAGGDFYEIGCADGKSGYMVETDAQGAFSHAIDCGRADAIGGGCTLTQVDSGSTSDNAIYNQKAKEIGFACNVSKYRSLGVDGDNEVVELACSDHPDGGFVLLPLKGGKGENYNCIRAEARQQTCKLTSKSLMYGNLGDQMTRKGKACQVTNTAGIGRDANGGDVVEVACSGGPGYVVIFSPGMNAVSQVLTCADASKVGASCKLK